MNDREHMLAMGDHPKSVAYWLSQDDPAASDDTPDPAAKGLPVSQDEE
jgi:hypothetical protein